MNKITKAKQIASLRRQDGRGYSRQKAMAWALIVLPGLQQLLPGLFPWLSVEMLSWLSSVLGLGILVTRANQAIL